MGEKTLDTRVIWDIPGTKYRFRVNKVRTDEGREFERGIHERPDGVGILALTDNLNVVLTSQYEEGPNEHIIKIPGGAVDGNESFEEAAQKELFEEAGYEAKRFDLLYEYKGDAVSRQNNKYFLATELYVPNRLQEADKMEPEIKRHHIPLEELLAVSLRNPKVSSATFRMAFMAYDRILNDPNYRQFREKLNIKPEVGTGLRYLFRGR